MSSKINFAMLIIFSSQELQPLELDKLDAVIGAEGRFFYNVDTFTANLADGSPASNGIDTIRIEKTDYEIQKGTWYLKFSR